MREVSDWTVRKQWSLLEAAALGRIDATRGRVRAIEVADAGRAVGHEPDERRAAGGRDRRVGLPEHGAIGRILDAGRAEHRGRRVVANAAGGDALLDRGRCVERIDPGVASLDRRPEFLGEPSRSERERVLAAKALVAVLGADL